MPGMGTSTATRNSDQTQNSTSALSSSSATNPWAAATPAIMGLLGNLQGQVGNASLTPNQTNAINSIENNSSLGPQFTPQISSYVSSLLSGGGATGQAGNVSRNLDTLRSQLTPIANGSQIGGNSALRPQLDQIATDVRDQVNPMFAAGGRAGSGQNMQTLARGIAAGQAPVIAAQYNQDRANQMAAANDLYGAGNTTAGVMSGMTQQDLANRGAGVTAAPSVMNSANSGSNATLAAEAQRTGIPLNILGLLTQIGVPLAGLGDTRTGSSTSDSITHGVGVDNVSQTASPLSMLGQLGGILGGMGGGGGAVGGIRSLAGLFG